MHVGFRFFGQIVVHHVGDAIDIQSARRDIGRDQRLDFARLETAQCIRARRLRFVAVNGRGVDVRAQQAFHHFIRAVFGAGEHNDLVHVVFFDQVDEQVVLVFLVDEHDFLGDALDRRFAGINGDLHRIMQQFLGQLGNHRGHRRREKQRVAFGREFGNHPTHRGNKSHVEHAVGFVENEQFDAVEVHLALLHQIEQTTGRGDDDIDAAAHGLHLRMLSDAAENHRVADIHMAAVGFDTVADLGREFAGRG